MDSISLDNFSLDDSSLDTYVSDEWVDRSILVEDGGYTDDECSSSDVPEDWEHDTSDVEDTLDIEEPELLQTKNKLIESIQIGVMSRFNIDEAIYGNNKTWIRDNARYLKFDSVDIINCLRIGRGTILKIIVDWFHGQQIPMRTDILCYAVRYRRTKYYRLICDYISSRRIESTGMCYAIRMNDEDSVNLILRYLPCSRTQGIITCIALGKLPLLERLLQTQDLIHLPLFIHRAVLSGSPDVLRLLISTYKCDEEILGRGCKALDITDQELISVFAECYKYRYNQLYLNRCSNARDSDYDFLFLRGYRVSAEILESANSVGIKSLQSWVDSHPEAML